ncbi:MAG: hypothetical protein GYA21_02340 [Myxococcales bacterium]|nr:hypothetical protein [Myxococcales bacterium]
MQSFVRAWSGRALILAVTLALFGCQKPSTEEKPKDAGKPAEASQAADVQATLKASEDDCVGPLETVGKPRELLFGDSRFELDGYWLKQKDSDPDEEEVIGILSDSKEFTPDNKKNLERILAFFEREKVRTIVHLGDIAGIMPIPGDITVPDKDEKGNPLSEEKKAALRRRATLEARRDAMRKSYDGLVDLVSVLAEKNLPVLVVSGNRECKTVFNSAMATLARDFPNVFNLNLIRRVDLDDLTIVSMPGYHDPEYVHCPWDRCLYYESDTLSLIRLAREAAPRNVMVISHGPPRQKDRQGIDAVSEGANVGNPALATALQQAGIRFGAFGNIQEAGGKATNLDGTSLVAQNTFVDSLFLNPGPADSMAWAMNDGTESRGMAAVIHFVGKKASYKIFRVGEEEKAPTPAPAPEKPAP